MDENLKEKIDEIFEIVVETNKKNGNKVNDNLLKEIIAIVIKNPLEEDRGKSQEQIDEIIRQYIKREGDI